MTETAISPRAWAMMFALAAIWGASFLSNRLALDEIGTISIVAARVGGGALLMWGWVLARRLPVPGGGRFALICLAMGILNNAIPFTLIVWGQTHVASGLAAIFNSTTAMFGVVVAAVVFADERLTGRKALGVGLGFAGVVVALGAGNLGAFDPGSLAQIAILGSSLSYAFAAAFARRTLKGIAPEVATAGMLSGAAVIMVPLALALEGAPTLDYGWPAWAALFYLVAFASALAYLLYYMVLASAGAGNLSLVTLLVAPFAIVLGALVYGEALPARAYTGFAILAAGLLVIDGRAVRLLVKFRRRLARTSAGERRAR